MALTTQNVPSSHQELADLVDTYCAPSDLPQAHWLRRLNLDRPRRNVHCLSPAARAAKRVLDVVGAALLLVALAPVMAAVALAVKLTSRGPVIYRQRRVGLNLRVADRRRESSGHVDRLDGSSPRRERRDPQRSDRRARDAWGKPFTMYKFRTMRTDAEARGARFTTAGDPRVTPIGRFLRRTRLDETPQLWNVLRGEMSLVGPRPERPEFIRGLSEEIPSYLERLGLKPGLTGLAQVVNGYDNDIDGFRRKVAFDLLYLQNCCVANDVKIMARTVGVVLTGKGAL